MHNATLNNSARLRRVMAVLADGKPHSTRDIMREANVCAVNSCVSELRENNIAVQCECLGQGRFQYTLLQPPAQSDLPLVFSENKACGGVGVGA